MLQSRSRRIECVCPFGLLASTVLSEVLISTIMCELELVEGICAWAWGTLSSCAFALRRSSASVTRSLACCGCRKESRRAFLEELLCGVVPLVVLRACPKGCCLASLHLVSSALFCIRNSFHRPRREHASVCRKELFLGIQGLAKPQSADNFGFVCDLKRGRRGSDQCLRVCGSKKSKEKRMHKVSFTSQLTR